MKTTRNHLLEALMCSLVIAFLPALASGQSALTDDAHTNSAPRTADENYGTSLNLMASPSGNAYIRFNITSTLPEGTARLDVAKAALKLYESYIQVALSLVFSPIGFEI